MLSLVSISPALNFYIHLVDEISMTIILICNRGDYLVPVFDYHVFIKSLTLVNWSHLVTTNDNCKGDGAYDLIYIVICHIANLILIEMIHRELFC